MGNSNPVRYTISSKYHCLEYLKSSSVELYLNYCGKEQCEAGHIYGPAQRQEYLLHYILKGSGSFTHNGVTYQLAEHDCFVIYPNETTIYSADEDNPWSYVWVGFNGSKAQTCLQAAGFSEDQRIRHFQKEIDIVYCVDKILEYHQPSIAHDLAREGYLYNLFSVLIQEFQSQSKIKIYEEYPQQAYVEYAIHFIEQNFHKNIKVTDIAAYVGINRSYLTKHFKRITGLSPQEFLLQFRMNNASVLLKTTDLPINRISKRIGYENPLTFSKAFKTYFGESPKNYRLNKDKLLVLNQKNMN